jgi:prespore-specific regulator
MTAARQDAWTEDDDLLLAEVTLRHIREGSTQLQAFEEVGERLQRTAAACGFRWNSLVRKRYDSAIQIAKAQRQQLKKRSAKRINRQPVIQNNTPFEELHAADYNQNAFKQELAQEPIELTSQQEIGFDSVIRFLRQQKESYKKLKHIDKDIRDKDREIERLREENAHMKKQLNSVQNEYQTVNDDYKALIKIMDRARKLAFLTDEEAEDKVSFKMDKNGNLERVDHRA